MSWVISILIVVYIILSFLSICIAADYDDLFDMKWDELTWYEKCAKVIDIINLSALVLMLLILFIAGVRYILLEIPFVKEIFTKMEWK